MGNDLHASGFFAKKGRIDINIKLQRFISCPLPKVMIIVVVSFEIAIVVAILPILPRVVVGVLDSVRSLGSGGMGEAGTPLVLQERLGVVCGEASVEREIVVGGARLHEGEGGSH